MVVVIVVRLPVEEETDVGRRRRGRGKRSGEEGRGVYDRKAHVYSVERSSQTFFYAVRLGIINPWEIGEGSYLIVLSSQRSNGLFLSVIFFSDMAKSQPSIIL